MMCRRRGNLHLGEAEAVRNIRIPMLWNYGRATSDRIMHIGESPLRTPQAAPAKQVDSHVPTEAALALDICRQSGQSAKCRTDNRISERLDRRMRRMRHSSG